MAAIQNRPILSLILPAQYICSRISTQSTTGQSSNATPTPTSSSHPLDLVQVPSSCGSTGRHEPVSTVLLTGAASIGAILIPAAAAAAQGKNLVPILPKMSAPAEHSGKCRLMPLKNKQKRVLGSQVTSRPSSTGRKCKTRKPPRAVNETSNEVRFILPKTTVLPLTITTSSATVCSTSSANNGLSSNNYLHSRSSNESNSCDGLNFNKDSLTSLSLSGFLKSSESSPCKMNNMDDGKKYSSSSHSQTVDTPKILLASLTQVSTGVLSSSCVPDGSNSSSPNNAQANGSSPVICSKDKSSNCSADLCLSVSSQEKDFLSAKEHKIQNLKSSASVLESVSQQNGSLVIPNRIHDKAVPKKKLIIIKSVTEEKTSAVGNCGSPFLTFLRNTNKSAFTLTKPPDSGSVMSSSSVTRSNSSGLPGRRNGVLTLPPSNISEKNVVDDTLHSLKIPYASSSIACASERTHFLKRDSVMSAQTPSTCNLKFSGFESASSMISGENTKISVQSVNNPSPSKGCMQTHVMSGCITDSDLLACGIDVDEPPDDAIVNPANHQKWTAAHSALLPALMNTGKKTIVINADDISSGQDVHIYSSSKIGGSVNSVMKRRKYMDMSSMATIDNTYAKTKRAHESHLPSNNSTKIDQHLLNTARGSRTKTDIRSEDFPSSHQEKSLEVPSLSALPAYGGGSLSKGRCSVTLSAGKAEALVLHDTATTVEKQCSNLSSVVNNSTSPRPKKTASKGQTMLCQVCGKLLRGPSSLRTHLLTHSPVKPHVCSVCHKRFRRRVCLRSHMLTHSDERPYVCTLCNSAFKTQQRLTSHSLRHTHENKEAQEMGYPCPHCTRVFETKQGLKSHSKKHLVKTPCSCDVCGKSFRSLTSLKLHNLMHKKPERLQHACEVCGRMYVYRSLLKRHMETHNNTEPKYSCQVCSQKFIWKSSMVCHFKIHVPKKHKCKLCSLSFHSEVKLAAHLKKHSNPKPHSCTLCLKKFAFRYLLINHIRRGHGHKNFYRVKTKKTMVDRVEINLPPDPPSPVPEGNQPELATLFPSRNVNLSATPSSSPRCVLEPSLHDANFHVDDVLVKGKFADSFSMENTSKNNECTDHSHASNALVNDDIINLSLLRPAKPNDNRPMQTEHNVNLGSVQMCERPESGTLLSEQLPRPDFSQMKQISGLSLHVQKFPSNHSATTKAYPNIRKPPPAYCNSPHNLSQSCHPQQEAGLLLNDSRNVGTNLVTSSLASGTSPASSSKAVFASPDDGSRLSCPPHPNLMPASTDPYLESSYSESPCYLSPAGVVPQGADKTGALLQVQGQDEAPAHDAHLNYNEHSTSGNQFSLYSGHGAHTSQYHNSHASTFHYNHSLASTSQDNPSQTSTPQYIQSQASTSQYIHSQTSTSQYIHSQTSTSLYSNHSHPLPSQDNHCEMSNSHYNHSHDASAQDKQCDTPSHQLNYDRNIHSTPADQFNHNQHNTHVLQEANHQHHEHQGQLYAQHLPAAAQSHEFNSNYPTLGVVNPNHHALNVPPPRFIVRPSHEGQASEIQHCSKTSTHPASTSSFSSVDARGCANFSSTTTSNASPMFGVVGFASPLDYPSPISGPGSAFVQTPSAGLTGDSSVGGSPLLPCEALEERGMAGLESLEQ